MSFFISLLVLSALIFFHELGHYYLARLNGVKVEVFSIGFGKTLYSFFAFGTQWRISMIPLGGYVKMKGQDDMDPSKIDYSKDSYNTKTPLARISILLAGPAANFILAFFLFLFIALGSPKVLLPYIGDVVKDSPAQKAGLLTGDKVIKINDLEIKTWEEMAKKIQLKANETLDFTIDRDGILQHLSITPSMRESVNEFNETIQKPMIGIAPLGETIDLELSFSESIAYAYNKTIWASGLIFGGLQRLISGAVPAKELGGIISIVKITSDASENGWMAVLFFAALISVNLGVLNLLPIPALDGGHIMFNLYELITKKAPSEKILINMTIAGWVILLSLMTLGIYNDINRLMH